jgi:ribonuclease HI
LIKKIVIYTDGGCRNNQSKNNVGSWAAILTYGEYTKEIFGIEENTTNNRMELTACIKALESIKNKEIIVEIISDSQYVCSSFNEGWVYKWEKNKWKDSNGKDIKNKDLWVKSLEILSDFKNVCFIKCRGHSDNIGNNKVDKLVNLTMDKYYSNNVYKTNFN